MELIIDRVVAPLNVAHRSLGTIIYGYYINLYTDHLSCSTIQVAATEFISGTEQPGVTQRLEGIVCMTLIY